MGRAQSRESRYGVLRVGLRSRLVEFDLGWASPCGRGVQRERGGTGGLATAEPPECGSVGACVVQALLGPPSDSDLLARDVARQPLEGALQFRQGVLRERPSIR